jgi:hypothetical protein
MSPTELFQASEIVIRLVLQLSPPLLHQDLGQLLLGSLSLPGLDFQAMMLIPLWCLLTPLAYLVEAWSQVDPMFVLTAAVL